MTKQTWVKDNGQWRKVKSAWVNVNGVWKKDAIPKGLILGSWKEFMSYFKKGVVYYSDDSLIIADYNLNTIKKFKSNNVSNLNFAKGDGEFLYVTHGSGSTSGNEYISKISQKDGVLCTRHISQDYQEDIAIPQKGSNFFINRDGKLNLFTKDNIVYKKVVTDKIWAASKLLAQEDGSVIFSDASNEYTYDNNGTLLSSKTIPDNGLTVGKTKDYMYRVIGKKNYNYDESEYQYELYLICYDKQDQEINRYTMYSNISFNLLPRDFYGNEQVEVVGDIVYCVNQSGSLVRLDNKLNRIWSRQHGAECWHFGKIFFIDSEKSAWVSYKNGTRKITKTGQVTTFENKYIKSGDFAGTYSAFPENFK